MIRAAHRRYVARAAIVERVALRIEAQHAEPLELDVVGLVAEPDVYLRSVAEMLRGVA